jgi:hypothetical protein
MNNTLRNLTLSAAALAALVSIAPKAAADEHGRGRGPGYAPRQEFRAPAFHGPAFRAPGRAYGAPFARPLARYGSARYGYGRAPFRAFSGVRFFSYCPGPGYVYLANYGWALPPFFGAVWVPAHYDIGGTWVEGFWQ